MDKSRITPDGITTLKKNKVFVFSTNKRGFHDENVVFLFKAVRGNAEGRRGQSYAIAVRDANDFVLPLSEIKHYVDRFILYAKAHQSNLFVVSLIGCKDTGYSPLDIAPLFREALTIKNIQLPRVFWEAIELIK